MKYKRFLNDDIIWIQYVYLTKRCKELKFLQGSILATSNLNLLPLNFYLWNIQIISLITSKYHENSCMRSNFLRYNSITMKFRYWNIIERKQIYFTCLSFDFSTRPLFLNCYISIPYSQLYFSHRRLNLYFFNSSEFTLKTFCNEIKIKVLNYHFDHDHFLYKQIL